MKLREIAGELGLKSLTPGIESEDREVRSGYVSDLLSDVLAHAPEGSVLVTVQVHMNVVAVASHAGLAAIVFALGRTPEEAVCARALEEGIPLYESEHTAFDLVGRLYGLGLRGWEHLPHET